MSSLHDQQASNTNEMRLKNASSNILTVSAASSMVTNVPFVFPANTGATGQFLTASGAPSGTTSWTSTSTIPNKYPPVPRDDYYRGLTNQLITLSLLDNDIKGGTLVSPANEISMNSNSFPNYGTLSTGATGGSFTYRSAPRFAGLDRFTYDIVDSTGIVSKLKATVYLSIENYEPVSSAGDPGPYLTYGRKSDNIVRLYKDGTVSTLFTATFPGYSGVPGTIGTNCLAVNRDDNLIYYTAHSATSGNMTKIYAYDYANPSDNIQFLLGDFSSQATTFNGGGAVYHKGNLFISTNSSIGDDYLVITVDPYYITAGPVGNQSYTSYTASFSGSEDIAITSMAWDYHGGNLLITGIGDSSIPRTAIVDPHSGQTLKTYTYASGTQEAYISSSYNFVYYYARDGSTSLEDISMFNGDRFVSQPNLGHSDLSDLAEWINELQPA